MLAPDQSPVSPRRNELAGTRWIACWMAAKPSSRSLAWQALRRVGLSFWQTGRPKGLAVAFQAEMTVTHSSAAGPASHVRGVSLSGWVWVVGLDLFSLGRREREGSVTSSSPASHVTFCDGCDASAAFLSLQR